MASPLTKWAEKGICFDCCKSTYLEQLFISPKLHLYPKSKNHNAYLQVEFDTGSCKTLATIAGHLQMAADVRLPTSSKLDRSLASYGSIQIMSDVQNPQQLSTQ